MKTRYILAGIVAVLVAAVSVSFAQPEEFEAAELEGVGLNENIGLGFYGTVPTVKYHFTPDISAQAGIGVSKVSPSGISDSSATYLVQAENILIRLGDVNLKYGGFFSLLHTSSNSAVLAGTVGAERRIAPNLNLSFDIIPFSIASEGRGSSTIFGILSGAVISGHFYF